MLLAALLLPPQPFLLHPPPSIQRCHTPVASIDPEPNTSRDARRRARLLGEVAGGTTDAELSGFEELFAGLREEEEKAIAAAHEQEMVAILDELGEGGTTPKRPPAAKPATKPAGPRARPLYAPDASAAPREPPGRSIDVTKPPPRQTPWGAPGADGLASASVGGQLVTLLPTRVMVFIDGTWLYYQLFGRGRRCEITRRYGDGWWETHHIDFSRLPQIISDHLSTELMRLQPYTQRAVEVVRVLVYSSYRDDEPSAGDVGSTLRQKMFLAMQELNFEVHLGEFTGGQEKCVDIALAVDMMHYATVPNAFDVAVLVSGDRDFVPALVRTRQKGKRVAVCSMRNSASLDYEDPAANIKDFGVCWLDDHLEDLVVTIDPSLLNQRPAMAQYLQDTVLEYLATTNGAAPYEELVLHLEQLALGGTSAHEYLEHEFGGLVPFVDNFPEVLRIERRAQAGGAVLYVTEVGSGRKTAKAEIPAAALPEEEAEAEAVEAAAAAKTVVTWEDAEAPAASKAAPGSGGASTAAAVFSTAADLLPKGRPPPRWQPPASGDGESSGGSGRSDGALIVDGSLLELLEEDAFASRKPGGDGASDGGRSVADLAHLTVPQLKLELRSRQLSAAGTKPTLLRRLLEALNEEDASAV